MKKSSHSLLALIAGASTATAQGPRPESCFPAIEDYANPGQCLPASTLPIPGYLLPLGPEIFVTPDGRVGVNNMSPDEGAQLDVRGTVKAPRVETQELYVVDIFSGSTFDFGSYGALGRIANPDGEPVLELRNNDQLGDGAGEIELWGVDDTATGLHTSQSQDFNAGWFGTFNGPWNLAWVTSFNGDPFSGAVAAFGQNLNTCGLQGENGTVYGWTKSFIQPHPTDATQEIQYVSLEGNEHGVYTRGTARVVDGVASIELPEDFQMVAREDGLTVHLTPLGSSRGVYVASKSPETVVIAENEDGGGNFEVDYVVMGLRSAMPLHDPIVPNTHFSPSPAKPINADALPSGYRNLMIENGTLHPDGTVNSSSAMRLGWRRDAESGRWTAGPEGTLARPANPRTSHLGK